MDCCILFRTAIYSLRLRVLITFHSWLERDEKLALVHVDSFCRTYINTWLKPILPFLSLLDSELSVNLSHAAYYRYCFFHIDNKSLISSKISTHPSLCNSHVCDDFYLLLKPLCHCAKCYFCRSYGWGWLQMGLWSHMGICRSVSTEQSKEVEND